MIFSKGMIIAIGVAAAVVSIIVYLGIHSLVPVNGNSPVFAAPTNTFIKGTYSPQSGYTFISQTTSSGRNSLPIGYNSPTITLKQGELESIHMINEDTSSKHNLNIDAFKDYYIYCKQRGIFSILLYHTSTDERSRSGSIITNVNAKQPYLQ